MTEILRKWHYFFPPIHIFLITTLVAHAWAYLILIPETTSQGTIIFNSTLTKLGRSRVYSLNAHKNGYFVKKLLGVDATSGEVFTKQKLDCTGVWYPNIFTIYVDSVLQPEEIPNKRRSARNNRDFWSFVHALQKNNDPDLAELKESSRHKKQPLGVKYFSMPLRIFIIGHGCNGEDISNPLLEPQEHHQSILSDKIAEAKNWISESFASFAMPSESEYSKICLKRSQFVNSISAFLPKTILSGICEVKYLGVSDPRFVIETSVGDLVAAYDFCILEPLWKISIFLDLSCYGNSGVISSMEHQLKIIYHHEQLNDTEIAHRVRRELKNQSPYFDQALYVASVIEEKAPGIPVITLRAKDPENSSITYSMSSLIDSRSQGMFGIDEKSGVVTTLTKLDRELFDLHYFRVIATDDSFPPRSGSTTLQVNVIDANDHNPVFESDSYEAAVRESVAIGTIIITVRATDQDVNKNAEIEYSFKNPQDEFSIDGKTGVVTTRKTLDREITAHYVLTVVASDSPPIGERRRTSALLNVKVLDDNDNYPQFTERAYTVTIPEDTDATHSPIIATVKATDADEGKNAAIRYVIIGGNTQAQFLIDSLTGDVFLAKPLDYEAIRNYRLVIRAQDGGNPSKSNTTQLMINVKDVNDNEPRFYSSLFQESVLESVPPGYSIVKVQAYDSDESANVALKYSLSERDEFGTPIAELPLAIDQNTGWIQTTRELDREGTSKYQFQVVVEDGGTPSKSATASVIINVQDVNDNDPLFNPKIYEVVVSEQDPPGTLVASVTATDPDENSRLHYEINNGNLRGRFSITSQNNRGLITIAHPLDYRQDKRYILTVSATDSGGRSDIATVYVNVSDANNYSPVFENAPYTAQVFEDAPVGTTVLVVQASDSDVGQNAQITYSLTSGADFSADSFSINPQTGAVVTTKVLDRETVSSYLLTVTARDGGVPSLSDTTDVEITVKDVNDNAPVFSSAMYTGVVSEDALVGTSVLQVQATDIDSGLNGRIKYSFNPPGSNVIEENSFAIDATLGVIRTFKNLDRESVANYSLKVYAIDRGTPSLYSIATVSIKVEDVNDSPPVFESEKLVLYIPENSPIGSTVGEIRAKDPDEGPNAVIQYSIIGGEDSNSFSLVTRPGWDKAEILTTVDLDYESPRKKFEMIVRAASPPLRNDVKVEIMVTDVNDNAPLLKDFQIVFNNFRGCFSNGVIGSIPAFDADVSDQLHYRILSGNNANLIMLNESSGEITLSPQLNTNVPKLASMEVLVSDGINEVKATMSLFVRLITEEMLYSSVTVRLSDMTEKAFLSPLLGFFVDALAAVIPCPREYIYLFSVQDEVDVDSKILKVSFSARRPDVTGEEFYTPQYLKERVYLNRAILARLSTVHVLPFDDNLCVKEPCLNYEHCLTVLKFGNASGFISSDTVLFRPIYPVSTFVCQCPHGFTGSREHYLCDTEVDLCYSNPCQNGAKCMRKEGGYSCVCRDGYAGQYCEIDLNLGTCQTGVCNAGVCTPNDRGKGFQCHCFGSEVHTTKNFPGAGRTVGKARITNKIPLSESQNGLLLYNGRYNEKHDFIALEIMNGSVQFSFSLGTNISRTTVSIPGGVNDGNWHTLTLSYFNKTGVISLDDCDVQLALKKGTLLGKKWACANSTTQVLSSKCAVFTETCHRFLDLTGPLQLGGLPSLPTDFQVANKDFEGCISDLHIDHKFIDLNSFVADNGTIPGCYQKKNFCSSNPCKNAGKCSEGWGTYICECKEGHGGKDCSEVTKSSWRFRGDGILAYNPLLRPIQLPWINSVSLKTLQRDAFVMSIQVGQNSSATMAIKNGYLDYSYNGETITLGQGIINDGLWHHIEVKWMSNDVWLSLDYGQREVTKTFNVKVQGLYVNKILVGGPDESYQSLSSDFGYFDGCIQDIKVGNQQTPLQRPTVQKNVSEGCSSTITCPEMKCPQNSECIEYWEHSKCSCHLGWYFDNLGDYCEKKVDQPCPSSWWGYPVCGPCQCNVELGYNPECNRTTGECYCNENHYQPLGSEKCLECQCYSVGSFTPKCDLLTGQCKCRAGVIGRRCDSCSNPYAEVTIHGCEVVYNACPRSFSSGLWWGRTPFGEQAVSNCPAGSTGKATRTCNGDFSAWEEPDLSNCTSDGFIKLQKVLNQLNRQDLHLNTFVAVKIAGDLEQATNHTVDLHSADIMIAQRLIERLINYEATMSGLNLTHSQDKDYIMNLVSSANAIIDPKYSDHWQTLSGVTGQGPDDLVMDIEKYLLTLTSSQGDIYTSPFEIVKPNIVLGLDVITTASVYGYEGSNEENHVGEKEKVILPDTSHFLHSSLKVNSIANMDSPTISFPKYNNYIQDKKNFDPYSRVLIPLNILGIENVKPGDLRDMKVPDRRAVFGYASYKEAGTLFPEEYDETVTKRWGIRLKVGSAVLSFSAMVPVFQEQTYDEVADGTDFVYKQLSEVRLVSPIRVMLWLDGEKQPIKSNPQCVHWTTARGKGEWSRSGCHTELPEYTDEFEPYIVNCTCYHLSTFAVLLDQIDLEYIPEPTFLEDLMTYIGFSLALLLLLSAVLILTCLRGRPTNSNSIHKNIVFCIFCGELIYFVALKLRSQLLHEEFPCKMIAMFLHYFWLSSFSWTLVDSLHLHRMLTELRDVNHGQMRFYYCLGYALPAIIVGLSVGVRADQYGNFYFCWLSIYESVVWSLVGPVSLAVAVTMAILMLSIRAAFTLKNHVLGYGNLRHAAFPKFVIYLMDYCVITLVWVSVIFLPLLGIVWILLILNVSERLPLLPLVLSLAVVIQAAYTLAGFCFVNARVRRNLYVSLLKCCGKDVPKDLDLSVDAIGSSSNIASDRPTSARSALAYRNADVCVSARRNMGISTSSTTSRSTAKTSSSPYRSDTQLRGTNTDTSTSNYNSTSEIPSFMRGYKAHGKIKEEGRGAQTDSDSDNSVDGRSLELASSHSSDDDTSSRPHRSTKRMKNTSNYRPNICEGVPAPPTLNVISQSELFPNLAPLYAPRWSSQVPQSYHSPGMGDQQEENTSPQPLPRPDIDPMSEYSSDPQKLTLLESPTYDKAGTYQVNLATVYEHENKADNYNMDGPELDEKIHLGEKYLFPYTAEEDHCSVPQLPPNNRLASRAGTRESPNLRGHLDSPTFTSEFRDSPTYFLKSRDSPSFHRDVVMSQRSSPHFSTPRESPHYGSNGFHHPSALGLQQRNASSTYSPLLIQGTNMEPEANVTESE
ncbi:hypothetical protein RUM43_008329 [Polyplax serrata]|uniref:Protocadherin-like wing polarity protein stan n=1 Tax=Polyplax serrata TaxID=468196 RepID=A0AAN8S8C5_POLSC